MPSLTSVAQIVLDSWLIAYDIAFFRTIQFSNQSTFKSEVGIGLRMETGTIIPFEFGMEQPDAW